eukprot:8667055-Ditylum_brightwellii.AAC.1
MDAIINSPYVEDKHWKISSWCRIYTKALFVSDIRSAAGTHVAHLCYNDKPPDSLMYERSLDWPQQGRPNSTSWKIYTGILKKYCAVQMADSGSHLTCGSKMIQNGDSK